MISPGQLLGSLRKSFPLIDHASDCYVVGGALRDLLMDREPVDVDLACAAPKAIASRFASEVGGRLVDLGKERFITYRVAAQGALYDFTELSGEIEVDLLRRDFTMNALALDLRSERLVDVTGGVEDIDKRVVRMVREENFVDDPLRIVKGARMVAAFGFDVDPDTAAAMRRHAAGILRVASERVRYELDTLLDHSTAARGIALLRETGADRFILGAPVNDETVRLLELAAEGDAVVRWALLFEPRSDADLHGIAMHMRWSERAAREVFAVRHLVSTIRSEGAERAVLEIHSRGEEAFYRALFILRLVGETAIADAAEGYVGGHREIFEARPLLTGRDLKEELGLPPGKVLGQAKEMAFEAQIRGEITTREEALRLVSRWLEGQTASD
jgi:tRNA nucleotidyltransferase (CCA-adding enzyme)